MNTATNIKKEYSPLPVAKWTRKSLLRVLDMMYQRYLIQVLNNAEELSLEELNKKLDFGLKQFRGIYDPIMNQGVKAKPL